MEHWDNVSENTKNFYANNPYFQYKKKELLKLVRKWGENLSDKKILKTDLYEEAVGYDDILFDIAQKNSEIYGIDISPNIVKKANSIKIAKNANMDFSIQDVRCLKFSDNSFNLIISNSTLDHFPEVSMAMQELNRVLKNNGILILTLHNKHNPLLYLLLKGAKIFNRYYKFYSEDAYSIKETKKLMEKAGFIIKDSTTILHIPPLIPSITNELYKKNNKFLKNIGWIIFNCSLFIANMPLLRHFTGYLIAIKGVKINNEQRY